MKNTKYYHFIKTKDGKLIDSFIDTDINGANFLKTQGKKKLKELGFRRVTNEKMA